MHGQTDNGCFIVCFLPHGIMRLRYCFSKSIGLDHSYQIMKTAWDDELDSFFGEERKRVQASPIRIDDKQNYLMLYSNEGIKVKIRKDIFSLKVTDDDDWIIMADVGDAPYRVDANNRRIHMQSIPSPSRFYGFGEKTGNLDKYMYRLKMENFNCFGYDVGPTDPMYCSIPFYIRLDKITHKACGYYYHNTAPSEFDMGKKRINYVGPHSSYTVDDGDIDLFVILGPEIKNVIASYNELTGRPTLPPLYSLGNIGSAMYVAETKRDSDKEIIRFVDRHIKNGFHCDFFYLSSGYYSHKNGERLAFEWNHSRFPSPIQFVNDMKSRGIRICANVKPGITQNHPRYKEFAEKNAFVNQIDGVPLVKNYIQGKASYLDFMKPLGRNLWMEMLINRLFKNGITDIWNDNCEFESFVDGLCGEEALKFSRMRSIFPNILAIIAHEAHKKMFENERQYIVSRSGSSGIQKYAQIWTGDNNSSWQSFKNSISILLGLSLSGVSSIGCDICGFAGGAPSQELFVRWIQSGIFQPRFCIHSAKADSTVTELWMYPRVVDIVRKALTLRYKLTLYLYSLFYDSCTNGTLIMRPMIYEFQQDSQLENESINFMYGPWLLICSIVDEGVTEQEIYLPEGIWYDWYTFERIQGGQIINKRITLETIPIFIRQGAIIPLLSEDNQRLPDMRKLHSIDFIIDASQPSNYDVYLDDGESNEYQNGEFLKIHIEVKQGEILFTSEGNHNANLEVLRLEIINSEGAPSDLWVNKSEYFRCFDASETSLHEKTWYYNNEKRSVNIQLPYANGPIQINWRDPGFLFDTRLLKL